MRRTAFFCVGVLTSVLSACGGGVPNPVNPTQGPALPVFSKTAVNQYPGMPVYVATYKKATWFPFVSQANVMAYIQRHAIANHAQALIAVTTFNGETGEVTVMDGVKWVTPDHDRVIDKIREPSEIRYGDAYHSVPSLYPTLSAISWALKKQYHDSVPAAFDALKHNRVNPRMNAAYMQLVTQMGGVQYASDYLWLINHYNHEQVADQALSALVRFHGASEKVQLVRVITANHFTLVANKAASRYAAIASQGDIPELVKLLQYHANGEVRVAAATALLRLGHRHDVEQAAQRDENRQVRATLKQLLLG